MRVEDIYDEEAEQAALARLLFAVYDWALESTQQVLEGALAFLGLEDFRLDDTATRKQLALAAEQVVKIDQSTRAQLGDVLREGQKRGYSDLQIADGVPADGYGGIRGLYLETWRGRAETIARTELATAQNAASLDRYAATGLVERVQIVEHEDTDEPCASRNGKVVPLSERPGLLHPNCRVGLIPLVEAGA